MELFSQDPRDISIPIAQPSTPAHGTVWAQVIPGADLVAFPAGLLFPHHVTTASCCLELITGP